LKLVESVDEQAVLERLVDDTKPPVPPECRPAGLTLLCSPAGLLQSASRLFGRPGTSNLMPPARMRFARRRKPA
jgi:hypothetical protein